MPRESTFQSRIIRKVEMLLPGCIVVRGDPSYRQGVPDWIILYEDRWAALEIKRDSRSTSQPNQEYYINLMDNLSFAAFVCPENEEEVLGDLQLALRGTR